MTFEERYKKLNPEQKRAVDTIEGPVMVIAGPGTGKTTVLTLRIAQILRKTDTPANGILAITFTDAGVKAMRQKLREVIGNTAHDVYIHTFHSFASAMMVEYPDHFIRIGDFKQITDVEAESIIRKILEEPGFSVLRPIGRPDTYLLNIIRAISDAKKEALTPHMIKQNALAEMERVKNDPANISSRGATKGQLKADARETLEKLSKTVLLADIYTKYEAVKTEEKVRDYDDLIIELLVTLKSDELLLRLLQERFLYILVDEHQDTNDSQNFIVSLLSEFFETPNIFIVGDEKQAIYRFQGASVENFLRLQSQFKSMQVIALDTNYRSHQSILDASFAMIEKNYSDDNLLDLRVKLQSGNGLTAKPLDIVMAENNPAMEEYLAEEIKKISEREPQAEIAVIVRRNRELERVLRLLENKGVAVSSERSVDIFHHPVGSAFFDLLEFLDDPAQISALAMTFAVGMWGLSFGKSLELLRLIRSGQIQNIEAEIPAILEIQKRILDDGAVGAVIFFAEKSGFTNILMRDPSFVHVWRGVVALAESLARGGNINNPAELIKAMLSYRKSAQMKNVKISVGSPDLSVRAMTAHGSKGLEFDYVFIPYATDEAWVNKSHGTSFVLPGTALDKAGSYLNDIQDMRRLFYVALTRAKKHAVILYGKEEYDGKQLTPLRFIDELHSDHINSVSIGRKELSVHDVVREGNDKTSQYHTLLINEAKKVLSETGLSVTALNHFLECPSKFLYESILKLPQAPSVSAEKGSAMHEAFSRVWKSHDRTAGNVEKIILETAKEYLQKSFLPSRDKLVLLSDFDLNAPIIAKALEGHFSFSGLISTEKWAERLFEVNGQKEKISIPLHGKLDAILEEGNSLSVFDYKTRKVMPVSAIKGETDSSDGNYFRQLVFYKILLSSALWANRNISTSLVFVSPDEKGRCPIISIPVEDSDVEAVLEDVKFLIESVWSGEIEKQYCDDPLCHYCGIRKLSI